MLRTLGIALQSFFNVMAGSFWVGRITSDVRGMSVTHKVLGVGHITIPRLKTYLSSVAMWPNRFRCEKTPSFKTFFTKH